ncbi:hypothetical protein ANCCAN_11833 [Ancylostoma caninum]|uniref:Uncharacterized protein n=1 Tax=Ancylostoma caninum TaxID=29170 RepID=A0A368GGR2_ANCCA|nr:hypothetical protein ANCCAN_11833 [Ancylostoma caninum]
MLSRSLSSFRNYNWFWIPMIMPMFGAVVGAWVYEFFIGFHIPNEPDPPVYKVIDDRNTDGQVRELQVQEAKP